MASKLDIVNRPEYFTDTMLHNNRGSISSTLLESVKARKPDAWRRLVDLYGQVVYRWCRKSGLKAEDAADVVQEVFTAVAQHVTDFQRQQPGGSFTGWLSTITRNKICDHFRRLEGRAQAQGGTRAQERMMEIPGPQGDRFDFCEAPGDCPDFCEAKMGLSPYGNTGPEGDSPLFPCEKKATVPSEADIQEAEKIVSHRAIELVRAEFEPRTWQAWWKTAVEGRSAADVAAEMGMSLAAVYKAKSRVLLRLRQELAGLHGGDAN
jgi:RNA polymerase sigma-70 factor, ECF subfamily